MTHWVLFAHFNVNNTVAMATDLVTMVTDMSKVGRSEEARHRNISAKTQNAQKFNLFYLQQTCPILIRSTLTLNLYMEDRKYGHFKSLKTRKNDSYLKSDYIGLLKIQVPPSRETSSEPAPCDSSSDSVKITLGCVRQLRRENKTKGGTDITRMILEREGYKEEEMTRADFLLAVTQISTAIKLSRTKWRLKPDLHVVHRLKKTPAPPTPPHASECNSPESYMPRVEFEEISPRQKRRRLELFYENTKKQILNNMEEYDVDVPLESVLGKLVQLMLPGKYCENGKVLEHGNPSKKFLEAADKVCARMDNKEAAALILPVYKNIARMVQMIGSNEAVDSMKLAESGRITHLMILETLPWARISPTVHVLLDHAWEWVAWNGDRGMSVWSEDPLESAQKRTRDIRALHTFRGSTKKSLEQTLNHGQLASNLILQASYISYITRRTWVLFAHFNVNNTVAMATDLVTMVTDMSKEFSQHNKNISVMGRSILSGKNAKCSEI
eukprot:sb/3464104/